MVIGCVLLIAHKSHGPRKMIREQHTLENHRKLDGGVVQEIESGKKSEIINFPPFFVEGLFFSKSALLAADNDFFQGPWSKALCSRNEEIEAAFLCFLCFRSKCLYFFLQKGFGFT